MRRLLILGGTLLLVLGIAMHLFAFAIGQISGPTPLGYFMVILVVLSYMIGALGIICTVLGILTDQKRP